MRKKMKKKLAKFVGGVSSIFFFSKKDKQLFGFMSWISGTWDAKRVLQQRVAGRLWALDLISHGRPDIGKLHKNLILFQSDLEAVSGPSWCRNQAIIGSGEADIPTLKEGIEYTLYITIKSRYWWSWQSLAFIIRPDSFAVNCSAHSWQRWPGEVKLDEVHRGGGCQEEGVWVRPRGGEEGRGAAVHGQDWCQGGGVQQGHHTRFLADKHLRMTFHTVNIIFQHCTFPRSCWCQATDMTGDEKLTLATHSQSSHNLTVWSSLPLSTRSPFSGS